MTLPLSYNITPEPAPRLGLVTLQSDLTIEGDMRRLLPERAELLVSRVPSAAEVSSDSLAQMEHHLTAAAALFPEGAAFDVVGYGCTSGTAQIGAARIAERVKAGCDTAHVSEPVSGLIACCRALGLARVGFVSPYVEEVSDNLRRVLAEADIATPAFGSFDVAEEARVARIDGDSILAAGETVARDAGLDGLFLSCTNLRTLDVIAPLEARLGIPVLSSNLVLAADMLARCPGDAYAGATPALHLARLIQRGA